LTNRALQPQSSRGEIPLDLKLCRESIRGNTVTGSYVPGPIWNGPVGQKVFLLSGKVLLSCLSARLH